MQIDYLKNHPEHIDRLASWHFAQWHELLPNWTLADARIELASHRHGRHLPTTLIALADETLLGSVSLILEDHEELRQYSPWLASLYVDVSARGRGVGHALVDRLVAEARALGINPLYLYTEDRVGWYQSMGWTLLHETEFRNGRRVGVMSIAP